MTVEIFSSDRTRELGQIEFNGVAIRQSDGSYRVPMTGGTPTPFGYTCQPPGLVTADEAIEIAERLGNGFVRGELHDGRQWLGS